MNDDPELTAWADVARRARIDRAREDAPEGSPVSPEAQARHLRRWQVVMLQAGGFHVRDCTFRLYGVLYDLSAANPLALGEIVSRKLFVRGEVDPPETPLPGAILYAYDAFALIETLRAWVGRRITDLAVAAVKREGRTTVTEEDIWAAFDNLDLEDIDE